MSYSLKLKGKVEIILHQPRGVERGVEHDPIALFGLTDKLKKQTDVYVPLHEKGHGTAFEVELLGEETSDLASRISPEIPAGAGLLVVVYANSLTTFDELPL